MINPFDTLTQADIVPKALATKFPQGHVDDILKAVNTLRAKHQVPPVTFSSQAADGAQMWANEMVRTGVFQHSPRETRGSFGENLAFIGRTGIDISNVKSLTSLVNQAVNMWYSEESSWDYINSTGKTKTAMTGHFTALVWKKTTQIGWGVAVTPLKNRVYIVMRFSPPGNITGGYKNNVLQPSSSISKKELTGTVVSASAEPGVTRCDLVN